MGIVPICMIIAQVTIVGMLALKQAAIASALMFPLLIITILFNFYIRQKHFEMTHHLPARDCLMMDLKNLSDGLNYSEIRGMYIQPELRERTKQPENASVEREMAHGLRFDTPPGSAAGGDDEEAGNATPGVGVGSLLKSRL